MTNEWQPESSDELRRQPPPPVYCYICGEAINEADLIPVYGKPDDTDPVGYIHGEVDCSA